MAVSGRGPDGTPDARPKAKGITDFREVLQDKSIDAVNISTPDHWHAYMTVEACKNGKDVYVEKPICVAIDEGRKMVQAARKYDRVVQVGTWQRSGVHFQKAVEIVSSGKLGKVTFVRTWNYGHQKQEGIGNPPDGSPPAGLDWDMWLGPAPKREFNKNRFGVDPNAVFVLPLVLGLRRRHDDRLGHSPAGHRADGVQRNRADDHHGLGGKFYLQDNRETPDTLQVTYEYPNGMIVTYENRETNAQSMFKHGYGILFHGTEGTLFVDRGGYKLVPEKRIVARGRWRCSARMTPCSITGRISSIASRRGSGPRATSRSAITRPPPRSWATWRYAASCASTGTRSVRPRCSPRRGRCSSASTASHGN